MVKAAAEAFKKQWINSVERALDILELYATAEQDRNLGAVAYPDPVTGQREMVDAATARIYYRQLERALKARQLTDADAARYEVIPSIWSSRASNERFGEGERISLPASFGSGSSTSAWRDPAS